MLYDGSAPVIHPQAIAVATVREGNKGVLLVVDVQVGVMRDAWEAPRVIKNVSRWRALPATGAFARRPMAHWSAATT